MRKALINVFEQPASLPMWWLCHTGLCEICHFPFRHHIGLFNDRITDDCTFAGFDEEGKVDYICTPAVYSGNLMGLGIPYDWICPRKEPHEFRPTCFLHDKQNGIDVMYFYKLTYSL